MTDVWTEWSALRHEFSEGEVAQNFVVNKMEKVVEGAVARIAELEAQAARPEIALFSRLMGLRMRAHDADWGDSWKYTPVPDILGQINHALVLLALVRSGSSTVEMAKKAADVANFAMMAAFSMSDVKAVVAALSEREG